MIRDAQEANEAVGPNDFEIARIRAVLPEYFDKDGSFMSDRLQEALRDGDVSLTREGTPSPTGGPAAQGIWFSSWEHLDRLRLGFPQFEASRR